MNTRENGAPMRAGTSTLCREGRRMGSYPLAVAAHIAVGIDCIRRGDLDGAAAALARAAALTRNAGAVVESRGRRAATNVNAEEGEIR
jgi:hypothetical protein